MVSSLHTLVEVVVATSGWANADAAVAGPLDVLTDRQREVLRLRVVVGLSADEAAAILGATPELVRITQHRALNRLRRELGMD
jgi:RNA polymerase sigma-70 factor (ECF subfamily)